MRNRVAGLILCGSLALGAGVRGQAPPAAGGAGPEPMLSGKPLSHWIKLLKDKDASVRHNAAYALSFAGPGAWAAVPALTDALKDDAKPVRLCAIAALGRIGPHAKPAIPALTECVADEDVDVRRGAVDALGHMGPGAEQAVPHLAAALSDADKTVRLCAAQSLGHLGRTADAVVPALTAALKDPDAHIRQKAIAALGCVRRAGGRRAPAAAPALIEALHDQDVEVRRLAAYVLGDFRTEAEAVVPALIAALGDDEIRVRGQAAYALGSMGRRARPAAPALLDAVRQTSALQLREKAAWAITRIDKAAARSAAAILSKSLRDRDSGVRMWAVMALGKMGSDGQAALPLLRELLHDEILDVRQLAAQAIAEIERETERHRGQTSAGHRVKAGGTDRAAASQGGKALHRKVEVKYQTDEEIDEAAVIAAARTFVETQNQGDAKRALACIYGAQRELLRKAVEKRKRDDPERAVERILVFRGRYRMQGRPLRNQLMARVRASAVTGKGSGSFLMIHFDGAWWVVAD